MKRRILSPELLFAADFVQQAHSSKPSLNDGATDYKNEPGLAVEAVLPAGSVGDGYLHANNNPGESVHNVPMLSTYR